MRCSGPWGEWDIEERITLATFQTPKVNEIYVPAGNSTGKTWNSGVVGNAWLFCRQPSQVIYLSTKKEQSKAQAWSKFLIVYDMIYAWCRRHQIELPEPLVERVDMRNDWWARVYAGHVRGDKSKSTGWSGFHAQYQIFIVDESPGLPDNVHEMLTGNITGKHNVLLAQGNPLMRQGWWYQGMQGEIPSHRKVFTISSKGSPNYLHRIWAEKYKEEHGEYPEDENIVTGDDGEPEFIDLVPGLAGYEWISRVEADPETKPGTPYHDGHILGVFPQGTEWGLVPWRDIQSAADRSRGWQMCIEGLGFEDWRQIHKTLGRNEAIGQIMAYAEANDLAILLPDFDRLAIGVDVADAGGNLSVITVLAGDKVLEQRIVDGKASVDLPPEVEKCLYDYEIWAVGIDKPGVGSGPVAILQARGIDVMEYKGGIPVDDADDRQEYADLNAWMAWDLRRSFIDQEIEIPDDEVLKQQVGGIQWQYTAGNKVKVPKPPKSPDRFDALRIAKWVQRFGDYSPAVVGNQLPANVGQFGTLGEW